MLNIKIDFKLLAKQKATLVNLWNELQSEPVKNKTKIQHIDGIVNLLDAIQDEYEPKETFHIGSNQYLPNGLGRPAATYYYVTNEKGQTISKKTKKPYKGKDMAHYKFNSESEAIEFMQTL